MKHRKRFLSLVSTAYPWEDVDAWGTEMSVQLGEKGNGSRVFHPAGRDSFHFLHIKYLATCLFIILSLQTSFFYLCLWPNRWLNLNATNEWTRISVPFSVIEGEGYGWPGTDLAFGVCALCRRLWPEQRKLRDLPQLPRELGTVLRESTPRRCFSSLI